jgi:hypothetical protein
MVARGKVIPEKKSLESLTIVTFDFEKIKHSSQSTQYDFVEVVVPLIDL